MSNRHSSTGVVEVEFHAEAYTEKCIGIVINPKPLTIVVPQHAAQAIEADVALITRVGDVLFKGAEILPDAHLTGVQLTVLQLASPDNHQNWTALAVLPRRIQPVVSGDALAIVTRAMTQVPRPRCE